jgi:hypothetical protein
MDTRARPTRLSSVVITALPDAPDPCGSSFDDVIGTSRDASRGSPLSVFSFGVGAERGSLLPITSLGFRSIALHEVLKVQQRSERRYPHADVFRSSRRASPLRSREAMHRDHEWLLPSLESDLSDKVVHCRGRDGILRPAEPHSFASAQGIRLPDRHHCKDDQTSHQGRLPMQDPTRFSCSARRVNEHLA